MKFFVIGLGSIGARHAGNLIAMGHTVWGYDKSVQAALQVKEELPGLEIAADFFDCDAYVICTPPDQHIAEMINAVEAGKHIFVEKPIGVPQDIEPLGKVLEEAKRKNLVVMVGNMLRFHPEVRRVKPLIKKQDIVFRVLQKNDRYTEPVILNWGAHEIDLALYLLGAATLKNAGKNTHYHPVEQHAMLELIHKNLARSRIYMDYLTDPEIRSFTVYPGGEEIDLRLPDWNDVYKDEMDCFARMVDGQFGLYEWECPALGSDGLATLKIIADAMRMAGE